MVSERRVAGSRVRRFSALQRAENSSIKQSFLANACVSKCFSALQRAENSSIRRKWPRAVL